MKTKEQIQKEIRFGDIFDVKEFTEDVFDGLFTPYDGFGYFHDGEKETDICVWDNVGAYKLYTAESGKYLYVIWYNK
jgi:hypothetical protein